MKGPFLEPTFSSPFSTRLPSEEIAAETQTQRWMKEKMEYRCVECEFPIKTLFVQYSPGNIRLMKCENCKAVADEYIECEFMIIFIDLILHKTKAYRHLLYNVLNQEILNFQACIDNLGYSAGPAMEVDLWFSSSRWLCFLLNRNEEQWVSSSSLSSLVWRCQKVFMDVFVANLLFFGVFLLVTRILLNESLGVSRCKRLLLSILVSSYFKIFLIAMMVWEFPSSVIFIIDMFVLSSNIVALKVISGSDLNSGICTCFCAHAVKLLVTQMANLGS